MLSDMRCQPTGDALDSSGFDCLNGAAHPDAGSCCGQGNNMDAVRDDALAVHRSTKGSLFFSSKTKTKKMQLAGRSFAAVINFYHRHFTNRPRSPPQWQTKSHEGSCKVEECGINNGCLYNYHDVGVLLPVCQADIHSAACLAEQGHETILGGTNQININLKSFQNTLVHLGHIAK